MSDEAYEAALQAAYKKGDGLFKKWEKLSTLGETLDPLFPACMEPMDNGQMQ